MKKMANVIAFGAIIVMLIIAVPAWAGNISVAPPPSEMRMVLKPDLAVVRNSVRAVSVDRNSITIVGEVTNIGKKNAGLFEVKVFYIYTGLGRQKPVHKFDVAGLKIGEVKSLSFRHRVEFEKDRIHHWKYVVDYTNQIDESNENNNESWGDYP